MKNILRIIAIAVMTMICGGAVYGFIRSPRLFKVLAVLVLALTIYLLYQLIRQWVGEVALKKRNKA